MRRRLDLQPLQVHPDGVRVNVNDRAALMAAVAAEFGQQRTRALTVDAIVARTVDVIPDAAHVSLTMRGAHDTFTTLASTSDLAYRADALQYSHREGPCVGSAVTQGFHRSGDAATDGRWPTWGPEAGALGVRSLLSVPLVGESERGGALNMYSEKPYLFDDPEMLDLALVFACHVAQAIRSSSAIEGMETALDSRHAIGVALGMVMERYDCSEDVAFTFIRRLSSHQNRKVRDIAVDLVRHRRAPAFGSGEHPRADV